MRDLIQKDEKPISFRPGYHLDNHSYLRYHPKAFDSHRLLRDKNKQS